MGVLPQYSGGYRRKMGFSNCVLHNWGSWTLSLSSSGEVATVWFSPTLCYLREGVMLEKFLLPSPVALTSPPPSPRLSGVLESFLEKPGLLQKLSHQWVSAQVSTLQNFSKSCHGGLGPVIHTSWLHSVYGGLSAYYSMHRWARFLLVPSVYRTDSTAPTEARLFVDGCPFLIVKNRGKKEECLMPHEALAHFFLVLTNISLIDETQVIYPFTYQRVSSLPPRFGNYE